MNELEMHHDGDGTYHMTHDMTERGLSIAVAEGVAAIRDVEITALIDNFGNYADPDALDRLFRVRPGEGHRDDAGVLCLNIEDVGITIHAEGEIVLET